ncbi:hypothetical protein AWC02_08380 [Mycolicibacter engbaekii]|uniref:Uncharacterized protein n=1 Tax=Mycolicibacter engbaekii TaxID=188915 RepID=A0A1X1TSV6_9MYCO|nr:hypothetical protein [Mycolicibacter engbaekii]ORV47623.1 hypothetical protein AWC02_08380 [Mycolicibacter engbaekii]
MTHDDVASLPATATTGEVVVMEQPEGLLVGGDPKAVEAYLERLRETAGNAVQVAGVDKALLANAPGLGIGIAAVLQQAGKFVQLHPDSVAAIRRGHLIPGTDGFFRMMTRGADNKFTEQLQWRPAMLGPQQLVSLQMIGVQVALKAAIADVSDSIRRVESKVGAVLRLAQADRAGDVLADNLTITRQLSYLEKNGSLPDAYWDSIAGLGPSLNATAERLRNHARRVLDTLDPNSSVQDRANAMRAAIADSLIGETLSLLVVAEESLYKWQRLHLARVEATEPKHLPQVLEHTRELLAYQLAEDGKLYRKAHEVVDAIAKTEALDGFRFWAVDQLAADRDALRIELDNFASARQHQVEGWNDMETPGVREAVDAAVEIAKPVAEKAIAAAGRGLSSLRGFVAQRFNQKEAVGNEEPSATPEPEVDR